MDRHLYLGCMWALCGAVTASAAVVQTAADGSTFDVADGVLTITVPSGKTQATYDYVANILNQASYGVTQVVKDGEGVLTAKAAPNYVGSWRIKAGVLEFNTASCLGKASTSATEATSITVEDGATLRSNLASASSFPNRIWRFAGNGASGCKAAFESTTASAVTMAETALVFLDGDSSWYPKTGYGTFQVSGARSVFDLCGHNFTMKGAAHHWGKFNSDLLITNSSESAASTFEACDTSGIKTSFGNLSMYGGARNTLSVSGNGRVYFEGLVNSDWSLKLSGPVRGKRAQPSASSGWHSVSPITVNGTITVGNEDNTTTGYGLTLKGSSLSGVNTPKVVINKGAWLILDVPTIDFSGDLQLLGGGDTTYRCQIRFLKDTPFLTTAEKTVSIADSDVWMDAETVRRLPNLSVTSGKSAITGNAAGSSIASVSVSGDAVATLDTPAAIGTCTIAAGTLKLGATMPEITNLVCTSSASVLDLDNRELTVRSLSGVPTLVSGGSVRVLEAVIDVTSSDGIVISPDIIYPTDGQIRFTWCGGTLPLGEHALVYFAPGVTVPQQLTGQAPDDCEVVFSTETVASGVHAGQTVVIAKVTPRSAPTHSSTAADGTTFVAADQVLTITVPAGVTNDDDYAQIALDCFVTNIVKAGAGSLQAKPLATYDGDFTVVGGFFVVGATSELGRPDVGVVRVKSGGAFEVRYNTADASITHQTLELAGTGPDGNGAFVGPRKGGYKPLQQVTYRLTDDAMWCNNGARCDFANSIIDVAGHTLSVRSTQSWSQNGYFYNVSVTNSVEGSAGGVRVISKGGGSYAKFQLDGPSSWWGGADNLIQFSQRLYLGRTDGDWTLVLGTSDGAWGANAGTSVADTNANYYAGPVKVATNSRFALNDSASPCPISLYGPVSGEAAYTLTLNSITHLFCDMTAFKGTLAFDGTRNNYYKGPNCVWIHPGCTLPNNGKTIVIKNTDLVMDEDAVFSLPDFKHTLGDIVVTGGGRGDSTVGRSTISSFELTSATNTLAFISPAIVAGEMKVTAGTLALGTNGVARTAAELPVFSNLVFAAGTTFDMDGSALTVPNFTGRPAVTNAGALTIGESLLVDSIDNVLETASSISFAPGAVIKVPATFSPLAGRPFEVCVADGGVLGDLPLVDDPRARPWRVEKSADATSLLLTRVQDGTLVIFR